MNQDEINDFFSTHPNDPAHMPSYNSDKAFKNNGPDVSS